MGSCVGKSSEVQAHSVIPIKNFGENNALLDKWSENQVKLLRKKFDEYKTTEGLDYEGFEKLFIDSSYLPKIVIKNCFDRYAMPGFGVINFRNFCILVAQVFLSHKVEKAGLIFRIFSKLGDDTWTSEEQQLFNSSYKDYLKMASKDSDVSFTQEPKIENFIDWSIKKMDFYYITKPFQMIPSPEKEKAIVYELLNDIKIEDGTVVYLVQYEWWETWNNYVAYGRYPDIGSSINKSINIGDRPVAINNTHLLCKNSNLKLKKNLRKDKDFIVVSAPLWQLFQEWYGGEPSITRKYIKSGKSIQLELYPPILTITPISKSGTNDTTSSITLMLSAGKTFSDILSEACKALDKPVVFSRLWIKSKGIWTIPLMSEALNQVKNLEEDEVLLETIITEKYKNYWPRDLIKDKASTISSNSITASSSNSDESKRSDTKKVIYIRGSKVPGIVGLINLGNTCYFNCIIQALVHTPLLQEFFSSSNMQSFLNKKYKIDDTVANEISNLSKEMWNTNYSKINPVRLYKLFTQRFPMFEGKDQHDCHEFLSMLLDTLHEELRREGDSGQSTIILENPENRQVEILESDRQWQLLQGTQGSIVSDICAGQTKTTLVCTSCNSKRVLFEIFTNLSLPIPIYTSIPLYCIIVPIEGPITKIGVIISVYSKVTELLNILFKYCEIPIENLMVIESNFTYNISILNDHPNETLQNLGITTKTDLIALEVRKKIESCEKMGRKALKYTESLEINDQIDIQYGGTWVTGKILDIKKNYIHEYLIEYDYQNLQEWKSLSHISPFRTYTSSDHCKPYHILMIHTSNQSNRKVLGFPFILSIGSWYTFEDLYKLAFSQAMRMVSKDIKTSQDCFKLFILDPMSLKCGLCREFKGCTGCPLLRNRSEIRTLAQDIRRVCIAAEWKELYFSLDIKYDVSVVQVKDKEKEISKPIDLSMCLDAFTKEENLDMVCEKCKNKTIKMTMEIWRAPDILILNLKRFTYSNGIAEKIQQLVNYSFTGFEISDYVKSIDTPVKVTMSTLATVNSYDLYAIVLHTGSIHGGHYTTLVKLSNTWVLFDDESTLELRESPENSNLVSNTYLLFYRRRRFSSSNVINLTYNPI
jgi:ubiquitin C-terminal hydrolase